jgi:dTDP-4-dehydrorhamnose reductase
MNILITGASGQVGGSLLRLKWPETITLLAPLRGELDLANAAQITSYFAEYDIDCVIHCAAYTAVDKAEDEPEKAFLINTEATRQIAELTAQASIPLIFISTDYVFDGSLSRPYRVDDPIHPLNVYGQSKARGEEAVRLNPQHVIVRTSWVVSSLGHNFIKTMLRLAKTQSNIRVVSDQSGAPTSAHDLALFLQSLALSHDNMPHKWGTYHFANDGQTHWAGVAEYVFKIARQLGMPAAHVEHIRTADYPTRAKRPAQSLLDLELTKHTFGINIRPWQNAVADIVAELSAQS